MNLLFICSKNQWRSPTAEKVFSHYENINTRSAGTLQSARHTVSIDDINWSDIIFVMENKHKKFLLEHFINVFNDNIASSTQIIVLDIPDDYQYMDKELVEWLTESVSVYLP